MTHTPNLFALKLVVISLGLVMAGAIVFVLTTITHMAKGELGSLNCPDATVNLEGRGTLQNVSPLGKTIQIIILYDKDTKVLTADRCTGTILQTLTIRP
jgi:hypothetical protein